MTNRRDFLVAAGTAAAACGLHRPSLSNAATPTDQPAMPVRFALNTSTIRGQKLSIDQQVEVVAQAGYDGIEPWIRDIEQYVKDGGQLATLKKQIDDAGLSVVSAIGFANWITDDDSERARGLEQAKRDMNLVKAIGGTYIAAPPIGAHKADQASPPLPVIADRYRSLLEIGDQEGVIPQLELWGFSKTLSKLSELAYVATGAQHDSACVLPDFYHIYKGGSDFAGLAMIESSRMHCFHMNDYPSDPPLNEIGDKHRVFPGDGVCELPKIIRGLLDRGFAGVFSLELFNPEYWERDALAVCKEGLQKSKAVVQAAMQ
ncbi:sugar phosphate isomerase/epimerase family protein [Planctomycetes bacterium K23_9]|uniref:Inosose isomerase n=1 Tax=Stieleria marina TaxID=1930275 RepID=A0A517P3E4_9BACT|nr:Inosose isomerase [Planctomycetes bacterium K23_9]